MAKILIISAPFSGHTNPTLPLAAELVRRGHDVGVINAPKWKNKIENIGAEFIPYLEYPENLSQFKELKRFFSAAYNTALSLQKHYDLLIYDSFFYPGKALADKLKIPCIRQIFQQAWNYKAIEKSRKCDRLRKLSNKAFITYKILDKFVLNKKTKCSMGIQGKNLISADLEDIAELNIVYVSEVFQPYRNTFDEKFIFTIPGIENTRKSNIHIPYDKMKLPIIYISLGSMISSKIFLKQCIKAFENKNITVILSCGKMEPKKLGKLPSNIYAYSFVPQLEVLQHADLFFTHGGMNSINEAMFYGVPMLVKPIINDQPVNAFYVEELKIGKEFKGFSTVKNIYEQSMEILNDSAIRMNAEKIKNIVHNDIGVSGVADKIEKICNCNMREKVIM